MWAWMTIWCIENDQISRSSIVGRTSCNSSAAAGQEGKKIKRFRMVATEYNPKMIMASRGAWRGSSQYEWVICIEEYIDCKMRAWKDKEGGRTKRIKSLVVSEQFLAKLSAEKAEWAQPAKKMATKVRMEKSRFINANPVGAAKTNKVGVSKSSFLRSRNFAPSNDWILCWVASRSWPLARKWPIGVRSQKSQHSLFLAFWPPTFILSWALPRSTLDLRRLTFLAHFTFYSASYNW